jgi:hypothetical protein
MLPGDDLLFFGHIRYPGLDTGRKWRFRVPVSHAFIGIDRRWRCVKWRDGFRLRLRRGHYDAAGEDEWQQEPDPHLNFSLTFTATNGEPADVIFNILEI